MSKYLFEICIFSISSYIVFIWIHIPRNIATTHSTKPTISAKPQYIEPEFTPHVAEFERIYSQSITFGMEFTNKLSGDRVGECRYWSDGAKLILVLKKWWDEEDSDLRKKALIFHELGHCQLDQYEHRESRWIDLCPKSIMHSRIPSYRCLKKHWERYEKELRR